MLFAFNTWLLLKASLDTALAAGLWNAGSLNGLTWAKTWPSAPIIMLMLAGAALLVRRMRLLEMGDDSACALGVSVERSRLAMMLVAVVLTAAATALAGPISFIALVAPHIARRLSGTARWGLTQAALCGALLLLAADLCAQQLFMPYQLPVGVVTVSIGGIYRRPQRHYSRWSFHGHNRTQWLREIDAVADSQSADDPGKRSRLAGR